MGILGQARVQIQLAFNPYLHAGLEGPYRQPRPSHRVQALEGHPGHPSIPNQPSFASHVSKMADSRYTQPFLSPGNRHMWSTRVAQEGERPCSMPSHSPHEETARHEAPSLSTQ